MTHSSHDIEKATAYIRGHWKEPPKAGLVLGTGLGDLAEEIKAAAKLPYDSIPGFPVSTALGHPGRLWCGELAGAPVVAMQGRCHLYEGYSPDDVAFPARVMAALGCELFLATNASGGLHPSLVQGEIVVVSDHINLLWGTPSVAMHDRFPGRAERVERFPYEATLVQTALAIARASGIVARSGVYAAVLGPNYETRAELRFLRRIGADVVGMSTVPEVLAAAECGMRCVAFSTVTNVCRPDVRQHVAGPEVVAAAHAVAPNVATLVRGILRAAFA